MPAQHPKLPLDDLRAAAGDNEVARARIEALRRELNESHPKAANIREHVAELRKHASLASIVANWFEDPRTQMFINEIVQAGL